MLSLCHEILGPVVGTIVIGEYMHRYMGAGRLKHQSLFAPGRVVLADFPKQDQIERAACVHDYLKIAISRRRVSD